MPIAEADWLAAIDVIEGQSRPPRWSPQASRAFTPDAEASRVAVRDSAKRGSVTIS